MTDFWNSYWASFFSPVNLNGRNSSSDDQFKATVGAFQTFAESMRSVWLDSAPSRANDEAVAAYFANLSRLVGEGRGEILESWVSSWCKASSSMMNTPVGAPFEHFAEQILESAGSVPPMGPQRELLSMLQDWRKQSRAHVQATTILATHFRAILVDALSSVSTYLSNDSAAPLDSLQALFDLWIESAEEAYAKRVMTDSYSRDFGDYVNTSAKLHRMQSAIQDRHLSQIGLASRSDILALQQANEALKAKVRELGERQTQFEPVAAKQADSDGAAPRQQKTSKKRKPTQNLKRLPKRKVKQRKPAPARTAAGFVIDDFLE